MKPQTFMNLSGEAVRAAMDFYKLSAQDLLVIYDDYIDIIDYKLKNFDDEAYDRQLGLYKAYVKSKTNKPVKCHLLSIIDAKSREVEVWKWIIIVLVKY